MTYHSIKEADFTPAIFSGDNTVSCRRCGHYPRHFAAIYKEDGEIRVEWSNEISCYNWERFDGPLGEFLAWHDRVSPSVSYDRHSVYHDFMEHVRREF